MEVVLSMVVLVVGVWMFVGVWIFGLDGVLFVYVGLVWCEIVLGVFVFVMCVGE